MVGIQARHSGKYCQQPRIHQHYQTLPPAILAIAYPCQPMTSPLTMLSYHPYHLQVEPFDPSNYYVAEKYHQNYFALNPGQGYCRAVVGPKVAKIRGKFMKLLAV